MKRTRPVSLTLDTETCDYRNTDSYTNIDLTNLTDEEYARLNVMNLEWGDTVCHDDKEFQEEPISYLNLPTGCILAPYRDPEHVGGDRGLGWSPGMVGVDATALQSNWVYIPGVWVVRMAYHFNEEELEVARAEAVEEGKDPRWVSRVRCRFGFRPIPTNFLHEEGE